MSKGSRERDHTTWLYMSVDISPRRVRRLLKQGVRPDQMPTKSVAVVLDGGCRRFWRKHRHKFAEIKNCRARFQKIEQREDGSFYARPFMKKDVQA